MSQFVHLRLGDCVSVMAGMEEASVQAIISDPPYGLSFMGKDWDRLALPARTWEAGGGFTKPGIGDREIDWPSYSAMSRFGTTNPTCAECGGRLRGAKKCTCEQPHDHWKPVGKRRKLPEDTPDFMTSGGMTSHLQAMQTWHRMWLEQAYRVLVPGGILKAFGGTRTFHRLAMAMEEVGFVDINMMAWGYGSGFPKSLNVGKAIDKAAGAEREVVGNKGELAGRNIRNHALLHGQTTPMRSSWSQDITIPTTDEAKRWEGWGTALKPAWEPVLIGHKP